MGIRGELILMQYKYLIITSSGGNGLVQAANAKKQDIMSLDKDSEVIIKDLMLQWAMWPIGKYGVALWNIFQKRGNIFLQDVFVKCEGAADILFWPHIFFKALRTLFKHKIDFVIDTQCVATSAIIKAVRCYNKYSNKKVFVEKYIVDLPTNRASHFFKNIKKLSKKDKNLIKIVSLEPLLSMDETEEEFWEKNAEVKMDKIRYEKYFIRKGFKKYQNMKRDGNNYVIRINDHNKNNEFTLKNDDILISLILGSHPSFDSTCDYVKKTINYYKNNNEDKDIYMFVYCGDENSPLFNEIIKIISKEKAFPINLNIIPMPFQNDEFIASLFFRSDLTITRSGGQTVMEILAVGDGKHCIHSESKNNHSLNELLKGMTYLEGGNALYLIKMKGAEIININTYEEILKKIG